MEIIILMGANEDKRETLGENLKQQENCSTSSFYCLRILEVSPKSAEEY